MAIEISPPVAGTAGTLLAGAGGYATATGLRDLHAATRLDQFDSLTRMLPALEQLDDTTRTATAYLDRLGGVMDSVRLPGEKSLGKLPWIGGIVDEASRAAKLGAVAREISRLDERQLLGAASALGEQTSGLIQAARGDVARFSSVRTGTMRAGATLGLGAAGAAAGLLLLGSAAFDIA